MLALMLRERPAQGIDRVRHSSDRSPARNHEPKRSQCHRPRVQRTARGLLGVPDADAPRLGVRPRKGDHDGPLQKGRPVIGGRNVRLVEAPNPPHVDATVLGLSPFARQY